MAEMMRNLVFRGVGDLVIEEHDVPECGPDQILIRVEACAICTWEQRIYTGVNKVEFPFIGGHEFCGHIEALGENVDRNHWKIGDQVVCGTFAACGNCPQCKMGNYEACVSFNHSAQQPGLPHHGMGGMSSHYLANPDQVFHLDDVSAKQGAFAEPLSCVLHSVETAEVQFGDICLVIGCGIMGQLHAMLAARKGGMVIVSDTNTERTDLALKLGAKYAINPAEEDLVKRVEEITRGTMCDVVFDTTPIPAVVDDAISVLAPNGKVVLYSSMHPADPVPFDPNKIHGKNMKILGTANSNRRDFVRAARLIEQGTVSMEPFISEVYPLDQAVEAFESAIKADKFRVVLTF